MIYAVTGGTGFLGSWLVKELLGSGHKVRILARSIVECDNEENVENFQGSIMDAATLTRVFAGVDGVFHLAGIVEHSRRNSESVFEANVDGTLAVLRAAKMAGVRRVVYASTSGTVAVAKDPTFVATESSDFATETVAGWPYYMSKIKAEKEAVEFCNSNGLELICMRPTLILGPGDVRLSSCRSILDFLDQKIPFVPSGGLSFVDVRDAAKAFAVAMEKGVAGSTYLLGHENMTLEVYFKRLESLSGVPSPWLKIPSTAAWAMAASANGLSGMFGRWDPSLDPVVVEMSQHFWYLDSLKAKQDLGFSPRDGTSTLRDTVDWLLQHKSEFKG